MLKVRIIEKVCKKDRDDLELKSKAIVKYVDGEVQLSKYLKVRDFIRSQKALQYNIDNRLPESLLENAKKIASLYDKVYDKFKGNISLTSGYRSPKLNKRVGGSTTSQHKSALAIDIQGRNGVKNSTIFNWVRYNLQYQQIIWEMGTSVEPAWTHVGYGTKMQYLRIKGGISKSIDKNNDSDWDV